MSAPYPESDHHAPATAWLRCKCGYVGNMQLYQTRAGSYGSIQGPPEPPVVEAGCPLCRLLHDEYGDRADASSAGDAS